MSLDLDAASEALARDGVSVADGVLADATIAALRREGETLATEEMLTPAGIGRAARHHVDQGRRGDLIHWIDPSAASDAVRAYLSVIESLRRSLNHRCLLNVQRFEAHLALYRAGARYARHRDRFQDCDDRVVSTVLYVNAHWCDADGGELCLYPPGRDALRIAPVGGRLAMFLSEIEHEVLPAWRDRLSLTGWLKTR